MLIFESFTSFFHHLYPYEMLIFWLENKLVMLNQKIQWYDVGNILVVQDSKWNWSSDLLHNLTGKKNVLHLKKTGCVYLKSKDLKMATERKRS